MSRALVGFSLVLSLVAVGLSLRSPSEPAELKYEPARQNHDAEALQRRLDRIDNDIRLLLTRVSALERPLNEPAISNAEGGSGPELANEVSQLRTEVHKLMSGEILASESAKTAVQDLIKEAAAERQRQVSMQMANRQESAEAERKVKWKEFAVSAKLMYAQEQELNKRLALEEGIRSSMSEAPQEKSRELFMQYFEQRQVTDTSMNALLDESQKEKYQQRRSEDKRVTFFNAASRRGSPDAATQP
jgi:hypothetical protein